MRSFYTVLFLLALIQFYAFPQEGIYSFDETLEIPDQYLAPDHVVEKTNTNIQQQTSVRNGSWNKDFTVPGIVGTIYATATDGANFYVGGRFRIAGNTEVNSIARWDGNKWYPIGEGPENGVYGDIPSVEALAWADGKLFIAGQFSHAGTVAVNGIAFWDGSQWNKLGTDSTNGVRRMIIVENDTLILRGTIYSLLAHNNKIYVGGDFQFAGADTVSGIAAWNVDMEKWETMDRGIERIKGYSQPTVFTITATENNIYAGGTFYFLPEGEPAKNIARWNGTAWSSIGEAESFVTDLKTDHESNIYAVGFFVADEISGACGVGKWDGNAWQSLAGPEGYNSSVSTLQVFNSDLYAGGIFRNDELLPAAAMAKWDGTSWQLLDVLGFAGNPNIPGHVNGIEVVNNKLYVAGNFTRAGELFPVNVAEWDFAGSTWKILDDGNVNKGIYDGHIMALEKGGDTIYAGGDFNVAGGVYARNIAKWTGSEWKSIGTEHNNGIRGTVYTILADNNDVYVGGYFGSAGPLAAYHIAKWDGNAWSQIGIGVGGVQGAHVRALAKSGDYLYVAGYFAIVGEKDNWEIPANSIARFNLTTNHWEPLGRGIEYVYGIPGRVYDMEVHGDKIYVGGEFLSVDDKFYENFVVLENNKWAGFGDNHDIGVGGSVRTIKVVNDEILIGGVLRTERNGASHGILKWTGEKWTDVGERLSAGDRDVFVNDIAAFDSGFIAGGFFQNAGDSVLNNIAYFNANAWKDLGGGVRPGVSRIAVWDKKIFTAGPAEIFTTDGPNLAFTQFKFTDPVPPPPPEHTYIPDIPTGITTIVNYPNPFSARTTIHFSVPMSGNVQISVIDKNGREIHSLLNAYKQAGNYTTEFEAGSLPGGVYFCRIVIGNYSETRKMILLR